MIGELRFDVRGSHKRAVLTDGMMWECDDKVLEDYLNSVCPLGDRAKTAQDKVHGLFWAGERLGAEVSLAV